MGATSTTTLARPCTGARARPATAGSGEGATGPALAGVDQRLTIEQHVAVVRDGRGSMPGWAGTLTEEEIGAVVDYERTVLAAGP